MRVADAKPLDLESPAVGIEVAIRFDGNVLWVNIDGRCMLRVCRIEVPIEVNDDRRSEWLISK